MITYTLVVDDLGDGSKLAGVGAGNEQHNAANLHEPPLACRNVNVAHCFDCRRVWIRRLGQSLDCRRRDDGGTVPGCVGEVSMVVVAVASSSDDFDKSGGHFARTQSKRAGGPGLAARRGRIAGRAVRTLIKSEPPPLLTFFACTTLHHVSDTALGLLQATTHINW